MIVWLPDHLIGQACLKEISVKSGAAFQIEKKCSLSEKQAVCQAFTCSRLPDDRIESPKGKNKKEDKNK
jgi:hypothetical protein